MTTMSFVSRSAKLMLRSLIRLYQVLLSPLLGPSCRFQPTCSTYALEAIENHGPWRGTSLAIRRLARCHPIRSLGGSEGFDPVPPRQLPHQQNEHPQ